MAPAMMFGFVAINALLAHAFTEIPSYTSTSSSYEMTAVPSLAPAFTDTAAYIVTTATTAFASPTFSAAASPPACSTVTCPAINGQTCNDAVGVSYGILCDIKLSGTVITNSGKKHRREAWGISDGADPAKTKRDYTGTFENCVEFCDQYDSADCKGVTFDGGYCMMYDTITGSFAAAGEIAAFRQ